MSIHSPRSDFLTALRECGLPTATSILQFCLDAGHELSMPAGATKWNDLSGNGYDFNNGSAAGADGQDMVLTGTPGQRSSGEYWGTPSVSGYMTYDAANEASFRDAHKATAIRSYTNWFYVPSGAWSNPYHAWATEQNGTGVGQKGIICRIGATNADHQAGFLMIVDNTTLWNAYSGVQIVENAWNLVTWTWNNNNAAAGASNWLNIFVNANGNWNNGASVAGGGLSATDATQTLRLGHTGLAGSGPPVGIRYGQGAFFQNHLITFEQHRALFQRTRSKYGV